MLISRRMKDNLGPMLSKQMVQKSRIAHTASNRNDLDRRQRLAIADNRRQLS